MIRAALLVMLGGCDLLFGLDYIAPVDSSIDGTTADGDGDGGTGDGSTGPESRIVFRVLADSVCQGKVAAGSVYMREAPAAPVTVTIASADTSIVQFDLPVVFTFGATNWNLQQTLTARGIMMSATPIVVTATAPGEITVTDNMIVIPPC